MVLSIDYISVSKRDSRTIKVVVVSAQEYIRNWEEGIRKPLEANYETREKELGKREKWIRKRRKY